jgi:hypothetical protein
MPIFTLPGSSLGKSEYLARKNRILLDPDQVKEARNALRNVISEKSSGPSDNDYVDMLKQLHRDVNPQISARLKQAGFETVGGRIYTKERAKHKFLALSDLLKTTQGKDEEAEAINGEYDKKAERFSGTSIHFDKLNWAIQGNTGGKHSIETLLRSGRNLNKLTDNDYRKILNEFHHSLPNRDVQDELNEAGFGTVSWLNSRQAKFRVLALAKRFALTHAQSPSGLREQIVETPPPPVVGRGERRKEEVNDILLILPSVERIDNSPLSQSQPSNLRRLLWDISYFFQEKYSKLSNKLYSNYSFDEIRKILSAQIRQGIDVHSEAQGFRITIPGRNGSQNIVISVRHKVSSSGAQYISMNAEDDTDFELRFEKGEDGFYEVTFLALVDRLAYD